MSRADYPADLAAVLDHFDVPPLSADFADRAMRRVREPAPPPLTPPRRDRRDLWRRGRQIVIGTVAFGMMSAAAVASGLLGAAGIEVPVLTAMLAPRPVVVAKPVRQPPVRLAVPVVAPPVPVAPVALPVPEDWRAVIKGKRAALRAQRRADREAFIDRHPGLRAAIRSGPAARRAYLADHPDVLIEVRARKAAARAARIERRRAFLNDPAVQARLEAMDPATRAVLIAARRERRAALRERRALRSGGFGVTGAEDQAEGSGSIAR